MKIKRVMFLCLMALVGCDENRNANSLYHKSQYHAPLLADKWHLSENVEENDLNQSIFITDFKIPVSKNDIKSVSFEIEPKMNAIAEPLKGEYIKSYFDKKNTSDATSIIVPVYGMYPDYLNTITFEIVFKDDSSVVFKKELDVPKYTNLDHKLENLDVVQKPARNTSFSFSYFAMQSKTRQGMVIADVDGNIRWAFNEQRFLSMANRSGLFYHNQFIRQKRGDLVIQTLTGDQRVIPIITTIDRMTPNHEVSVGKNGILLSVSGYVNGERKRESLLVEVNPNDGHVINQWDMGDILSKTIRDGGESPSKFVSTGFVRDWFHLNSAVYDHRDDSIIVSSRENFVMKLDYLTGRVKWVFGDETKLWGQYSSLQSLAITTGDVPPIGQHSLSLEANGELLMFNNGHESEHQPEGVLTGDSLASSSASAYKIDENKQTADLIWSYDNGIKCNICSSVCKHGSNYLITYASIDMQDGELMHESIQIIDGAGGLKAEYQFKGMCLVWNSKIISANTIYR